MLDIYPTLNELCGFEPKQNLDGRSLVPLLENTAENTSRAIVTTHGYKNHSVRSDRWRYTRYADGSEELYDQINDPKNFHNLAAKSRYSAVKTELSAWFPERDAEKDPVGNAQSRWKDVENKSEKNRNTIKTINPNVNESREYRIFISFLLNIHKKIIFHEKS